MFAKILGRLLFASGLAGLGVLSLWFGDFALSWQPVPDWVPGRTPLAYVSGVLLLAGGVALLGRRTAVAVRAAAVMAIFLTSWLVLLQAPRVATSPGDVGRWLGVGETLVLVTGGWVLFIELKKRIATGGGRFVANEKGLRTALVLFAVALPLIGLSHFVYVDATAGMVPAWLPERRTFAYLTGAGHMAAGLGLLFGIVPRLAATMEAAMISGFVVLLHVPGVLAAPRDRLQWTMLCVAMALNGASWVVAGSFAGEAWGKRRQLRSASAVDVARATG